MLLYILCLMTLETITGTQPGILFYVGGAGGSEVGGHSLRWAMKEQKSPHELREFRWSHGKGNILRDLQDTSDLNKRSEELRAELELTKAIHPNKPIFLIGKSTGAAIVLKVAEKLRPVTLERIILLSPAVSPQYDLSTAMASCRSEIIHYFSELDVPVLDWGTSHFGTADRIYGPSAGLKGFDKPVEEGKKLLYIRKLYQRRWNSSMMLLGHFGGHYGTSMPFFFLKEVLPWCVVEKL